MAQNNLKRLNDLRLDPAWNRREDDKAKRGIQEDMQRLEKGQEPLSSLPRLHGKG